MINNISRLKGKINNGEKLLPKLDAYESIYAFFFGIMCVLNRHVIHEPVSRSTILTSYVTPFGVMDILWLLVYIILTYMAVNILKLLIKRIDAVSIGSATKPALLWGVIFLFIIVAWIPYFMSYWPGGIYNDTLDSINIALGKQEWSNQNTVLYALWWKLIFWLGLVANQGDYGGLKLMTVVQPLIMAVTAASFFTWFRKRGVKLIFIILGVGAFGLFPVFPYYGISLWKDTLFGVNIFLYTWFLFMLAEKLQEIKSSSEAVLKTKGSFSTEKKALPIGTLWGAKNMGIYTILSLIIIFGRGNGIFVFITSAIVFYFIARKYISVKDMRRFLILSLAIFALSVIIQGPVYRAMNISRGGVAEQYGIPLQQTAYIISSGAKVTDEQWEVLENIVPREGWINLYSPLVVDTIKFDPLFNTNFFADNKAAFLKAYLGLSVKNPGAALKGYLLATTGFWDAWQSSSSAYICREHAWNAEYFMSDYFNMYTNKYLSDIVGPRWYISAGALAWIMLLAFIFVLKRTKNNGDGGIIYRNYLLPLVPGLALWITLLLATPLAFSFRYAFPLLLCQPIYWIVIKKNIE